MASSPSLTELQLPRMERGGNSRGSSLISVAAVEMFLLQRWPAILSISPYNAHKSMSWLMGKACSWARVSFNSTKSAYVTCSNSPP